MPRTMHGKQVKGPPSGAFDWLTDAINASKGPKSKRRRGTRNRGRSGTVDSRRQAAIVSEAYRLSAMIDRLPTEPDPSHPLRWSIRAQVLSNPDGPPIIVAPYTPASILAQLRTMRDWATVPEYREHWQAPSQVVGSDRWRAVRDGRNGERVRLVAPGVPVSTPASVRPATKRERDHDRERRARVTAGQPEPVASTAGGRSGRDLIALILERAGEVARSYGRSQDPVNAHGPTRPEYGPALPTTPGTGWAK